MPSVTCQNLIDPAMRIAGISKLPGTGPGTDGYAEAVKALNRMMGSLSLNGGYIFTTAIDDYTWPANTESRTFGPTGNEVITQAPLYIAAADWIMYGSNPEVQYTLRIVRTAPEWLSLSIPELATTYPGLLYTDGGQPNTRLHLWPVPTQSSVLRLNTWTRLKSNFAATSDIAYLPDGYEEAIVLNFALRLNSMYSSDIQRSQMQPNTPNLAAQALRRVRSLNSVSPKLISDADFINSGRDDSGLDARIAFLSGGLVG
jgi:hypothetical protein